jgi:hypothetical protein
VASGRRGRLYFIRFELEPVGTVTSRRPRARGATRAQQGGQFSMCGSNACRRGCFEGNEDLMTMGRGAGECVIVATGFQTFQPPQGRVHARVFQR